MPRNRTIYQCEGVYAGPSPSTGRHFTTGNYGNITQQAGPNPMTPNQVAQLQRIQSANYSFSLNRTPVQQFGELAPIDRILVEQPTVNLEFSYLLTSFFNEKIIGFFINSGNNVTAISGFLNKTSDDRNYFIKTVAEGNDLNTFPDNNTAFNSPVTAIGNGYITSYRSEGSVGNFPTVTVSVEGLNMNFDPASTGQVIPAVFPANGNAVTGWFYTLPTGVTHASGQTVGELTYAALRPGDINLSIGWVEGGITVSDAKIQSYSLAVDLNRDALQQLGSKYAFSREIRFPVNVSLSVTADLGDLASGKLSEIINNNTDYNLSVTINKPGTSINHVQYLIRGANLDSQEFSSQIGNNKSVTLNFTCPLGGPSMTGFGLYMSGAN